MGALQRLRVGVPAHGALRDLLGLLGPLFGFLRTGVSFRLRVHGRSFGSLCSLGSPLCCFPIYLRLPGISLGIGLCAFGRSFGVLGSLGTVSRDR